MALLALILSLHTDAISPSLSSFSCYFSAPPRFHVNSYPYSMPLPTNATEATALDTSGDGQLSPLDSPFSPYYPGDEYVDWVGLSVYYKGPNSQNINVAQPRGYCYGALRNHNPNNGVDTVDPWYENYCVGRNKACMVSAFQYLRQFLSDFCILAYSSLACDPSFTRL